MVRFAGKDSGLSAVRLITILVEIDPEVDFDSRRAAYFRQMRYGLFVSRLYRGPITKLNSSPQIRMALLASVMA